MVQEVEHQAVLLDIEKWRVLLAQRRRQTCLGSVRRHANRGPGGRCHLFEYDVPPDTALDDTGALLENLAGAGLVIEA